MAQHCANATCSYYLRHQHAAEFEDTARQCLDCGGPLTAGAAPLLAAVALARHEHSSRPPVVRAAVSLGAFAVFAGLAYVPIPGIALRHLGGPGRPLGLGMVGLAPFLTAAVVVEVLALLVPPLRRVRHGDSEARALIWRLTVGATALVALAQAAEAIHDLHSLARGEAFAYGDLVTSPRLALLALTAAALLGVALVKLVERAGLGAGVSVLMALGIARSLATGWTDSSAGLLGLFDLGGAAANAVRLGAVGLIAAGFAIWLARIDAPGTRLRAPTSGTIPLLIAAEALAVPALLGLPWLDRGDAVALGAKSALSAVLLVALALLFHWPKRIAALWSRAAPEAPLSRLSAAKDEATASLVPSALILAAVLALDHFGGDWLALANVGTTGLLLGAVGLDLVREWRFRSRAGEVIEVWPFQDPDRADIALHLLARAGIPAFTQGQAHRTLLQFFGPYIPLRVLVPWGERERARALLATPR